MIQDSIEWADGAFPLGEIFRSLAPTSNTEELISAMKEENKRSYEDLYSLFAPDWEDCEVSQRCRSLSGYDRALSIYSHLVIWLNQVSDEDQVDEPSIVEHIRLIMGKLSGALIQNTRDYLESVDVICRGEIL
jgi:hypothetical protein